TASGYAERPRAFEELLQILDGELRLITPTDPEGVPSTEYAVRSTEKETKTTGASENLPSHSITPHSEELPSSSNTPHSQVHPSPSNTPHSEVHPSPSRTPYSVLSTAYYQLTHDYLVPSLRQWLTRKQRETRRGRAELRLAERSAAWNAKPERRQLPAWWEWL